MSRIRPVDPNTASDAAKRLFAGVQKQLGLVPNMMRTMAQSPAVLDGYLVFGAALRRGLLSPAQQEQIALAVAETNDCDYCLSAHAALGRGAGLSSDQIAASREARAADAKTTAMLQFARAAVERRGAVSDEELAQARAALSDPEIVEVLAHVAINVFTNYFNRAAQTDIDFPKVAAGQPA